MTDQTPVETVTDVLHRHVSAALATIDAGLPSDRALREPTGDASAAEDMLMSEVMHGGPLTRQGLDIAASRVLASLAQYRDDFARVAYEWWDGSEPWEDIPEESREQFRGMVGAQLAFLTGGAR